MRGQEMLAGERSAWLRIQGGWCRVVCRASTMYACGERGDLRACRVGRVATAGACAKAWLARCSTSCTAPGVTCEVVFCSGWLWIQAAQTASHDAVRAQGAGARAWSAGCLQAPSTNDYSHAKPDARGLVSTVLWPTLNRSCSPTKTAYLWPHTQMPGAPKLQGRQAHGWTVQEYR